MEDNNDSRKLEQLEQQTPLLQTIDGATGAQTSLPPPSEQRTTTATNLEIDPSKLAANNNDNDDNNGNNNDNNYGNDNYNKDDTPISMKKNNDDKKKNEHQKLQENEYEPLVQTQSPTHLKSNRPADSDSAGSKLTETTPTTTATITAEEPPTLQQGMHQPKLQKQVQQQQQQRIPPKQNPSSSSSSSHQLRQRKSKIIPRQDLQPIVSKKQPPNSNQPNVAKAKQVDKSTLFKATPQPPIHNPKNKVQQRDGHNHTNSASHGKGPAIQVTLPADPANSMRSEIVFCQNSKEAQDLTDVPHINVDELCSNGGGLIEGIHFQYDQRHPPPVMPPNQSSSSPPPLPQQRQQLGSLKSSPLPTTTTRTTTKQQKQQYNSSNPQTTKKSKRKYSEISDPHRAKSKNKQSNNNPSKKNKATKFDVSTLLPLSDGPLKPSKGVVELLCRASNKILVSFESMDAAAQALGTSRKEVRQACRSFNAKDTSKKPPSSLLSRCILRYVSTSNAYQYGTHPLDYKTTRETHFERLERWASLPPKNTASADLTGGDDDDDDDDDVAIITLARKNKTPKSSSLKQQHNDSNDNKGSNYAGGSGTSPNSDKNNDKSSSSKSQSSKRSTTDPEKIMSFLRGAILWEDDSILPETINRKCIACQNGPARVVFLPCRHCVLCETCAKRSCPEYCPQCFVSITGRLLPEHHTWIEPRSRVMYG